ncbi:uncharacterized protein LACBIDRAFT_328887 [Laccaria bicolor S238N-H82]|uniref:Predicted protein n=1 Tax=Laccaria bicolor (strain S238N-H82 / ATCC MYA-4686) TaxID=486041 RepID=B0DGB3_LACBS|nr:uncharacterized protein LACBIDRAFT_328887 [Laccaria bicolor S238N-H82]EDR06485.1 predicted protein [Laccaria bicolor S238N-H82]|eukprot:XP_001882857.1 predicted protein [Laccaria bicolor S238N-H82]
MTSIDFYDSYASVFDAYAGTAVHDFLNGLMQFFSLRWVFTLEPLRALFHVYLLEMTFIGKIVKIEFYTERTSANSASGNFAQTQQHSTTPPSPPSCSPTTNTSPTTTTTDDDNTRPRQQRRPRQTTTTNDHGTQRRPHSRTRQPPTNHERPPTRQTRKTRDSDPLPPANDDRNTHHHKRRPPPTKTTTAAHEKRPAPMNDSRRPCKRQAPPTKSTQHTQTTSAAHEKRLAPTNNIRRPCKRRPPPTKNTQQTQTTTQSLSLHHSLHHSITPSPSLITLKFEVLTWFMNPCTTLPLIDIGVPQPAGAGEAVSDKVLAALTSALAADAPTAPLFNPAAISLHDLVVLQSLKHPELNKVAKFHNQKAAGTNAAIIKCLRALAMSTLASAAPIPPSPPPTSALTAPIPPSPCQSPVSASIPAPPHPTVNPSLHYPSYHAPTYPSYYYAPTYQPVSVCIGFNRFMTGL